MADHSASFGERVAELREQKKMPQRELARLAGVSQASVSRLESLIEPPLDIPLLSKISRAFGIALPELAPELQDRLQSLEQQSENDVFCVFCPNPFCQKNHHTLQNGVPSISWKSFESIAAAEFEEVNFCASCGEALVKQCPNCSRRMGNKLTRFCVRCGSKMTERPSKDEWSAIVNRLKVTTSEKAEGTGEIPF